jgi:hypothetical protein
VDPFATSDELGAYLGETLAGARLAQAEVFLEMASAGIRSWTRQDIELVTDDLIVLPGTYDWEIELPQRPVVEVSAVTVGGVTVAPAGYRLVGESLQRLVGGWTGTVAVTYTHGYEDIPRDIWAATLRLAAQMLENPQGYTQEGIGTYSVSYSDNADEPGGPMFGLSRYRRRAASVPMYRDRPVVWPVANG